MEPTQRRVERESRVRSLLSDYYAMEEADGEPAAQTDSQVVDVDQDPFDLDGSGFDAERYMEEMMQGERMKGMLEKTTNIRAEVKSLDNDMQMLVYENYTKFISATDTIRRMKDTIEDMDSDMTNLAGMITVISEGSTRINKNLSAHREKLDKLTSSRRLLNKLQFLTELPSELRKCMQTQNFADAIKHYQSTRGLLQRFKDLPAFKHLEGEIHDLMFDIEARLWDRLFQLDRNFEETKEARYLLVEFGKTDEACASAFLEKSKSTLTEHLCVADAGPADAMPSLSILSSGRSHAAATDEMPKFRDDLGGNFVYYLIRFIVIYQGLFMGPSSSSLDDSFLSVARELMNHYMESMRTKMCIEKEHLGEDEAAVLSMEEAKADVHTVVQQVNRFLATAEFGVLLIPEMDAITFARSTASTAVVNAVSSVFDRGIAVVDRETNGALLRGCEHASNSKEILAVAGRVAADLRSTFATCLDCLAPLSALDGGIDQDDVKHQVHGVAMAYMTSVGTRMVEFISMGPTSGELSPAAVQTFDRLQPIVCLCAAKVCMHFADDSAADEAADALAALFGASLDIPAELAEAAGGFSATQVRAEFATHVQRLLQLYVAVRSAGLGTLLAAAFDPASEVWCASAPPTGVRAALDPAVQMVATIDAECRPMVAGQLPTQRNHDFSNAPIVTALSEVKLEGSAFRLMKQKVELLSRKEPLDFTSAVELCLCKAIRTLGEVERLSSYSSAGAQQAQVDLTYFAAILQEFGGDPDVIEPSMVELLQQLGDRCYEDGGFTPLSRDAVEQMVARKIEE